jgi:hypothetical protein
MKPEPVVRCADDLGKLCLRPKLWHYAAMLATFFAFQLLAGWTGWHWLHPVPVVLIMVALIPIIIRQQRNYQRFIGSVLCPHCGLAAGKTFTKQGILHLRCRHCGKETRTDSLVLYQGPPTKV